MSLKKLFISVPTSQIICSTTSFLGKHLKCDFDIIVEYILEDHIATIEQGSDVLHIFSCDDLMLHRRFNRKNLFEVQNKFFVVSLHCSDNELRSVSGN